MIIETSRLLLREHHVEDAPFIFELNSDFEVVRYTGDQPFKDVAEAKKLIEENILVEYLKYGYGRWAMIEKVSGRYIGWCGLKYQRENGFTDLGYRLKQAAWNKGYATEAALSCIEFAWKHKIPRLMGRAMKENSASIKVLEKCGFYYDHDEIMHDQKATVYFLDKP